MNESSNGRVDEAFQTNGPPDPALQLRAGDFVEVRSVEEILATLDEDGRLEFLPFMPEMLKYCGRRFTVSKRADKACDRIEFKGLRRMKDAVHLGQLRCDGEAHGGCQAGCLLYWKEAWLKEVRAEDASAPAPDPPVAGAISRLMDGTVGRPDELDPDATVYSCQATELNRATDSPLRLEDPRQYWNDVRSGNVSPAGAIRGLVIGVYNRFQSLSKRYLPGWLLIRQGKRYPQIEGRLTKTPSSRLDLQPGELVRIKSKKDIIATLDTRNRNRGLSFDAEMLKYCGRTARVLRRVERIIEEGTGKMTQIQSDCIILDGVFCTGDYHRFCPRGIYPYWREIWLERVAEPTKLV